MFITKLGHSCVLVETQDNVGLFDPGVWSDRSLIDDIEHVDRIIYTHEHPDHFDTDVLKSLLKKFPEVHVICNESIASKIKNAEIQATIRDETQCTVIFDAPHEQLPVPGSTPPTQNGYHFQELFTHPGDSQSFSETKKVLAMPFIAPWGKTGDSVDKVVKLKPEYVLPIHDWHYTDDAKKWLQSLLESVFNDTEIKLLPNKIGERIEIC